MADQDIRVTAKMQVDGLSEIQSRLRPIIGTIREAEEAVQRLNQTMQERGQPPVSVQPASGTAVPGRVAPVEVSERMQPLGRMRPAEAEILRAIEERKRALAAIDNQLEEIFKKRTPAMDVYQRTIDQGFTHETAVRRAIASDRPGAGDMVRVRAIEPEARKLGREIESLERQADRIGRHVGTGVSGALNQWLPRFNRVLTMGLGLVGIGSAIGIVAQSRSRAIEFYTGGNEIGLMGFGKRGVEGLQDAALKASQASGLVSGAPAEAQRTGAAVMRGFGGNAPDAETINKFSQLGLYFGMGRSGFANMAEQMAVTSLPDANQALKFGTQAAGVADSAGLSPKQRQFFLAQNRDHFEMLARFYGGRPVSVEDYFKGVGSMMQVLGPLKREGVQVPQLLADVTRQTINALSPFGKNVGDMLRQATLFGYSLDDMRQAGGGAGPFFGAAKLLADTIRSPEGVMGAIQRLASAPLVGMETGPGAGQYEGEDFSRLLVIGELAGIGDVLKRLELAKGGLLEKILRAGSVEDLSKEDRLKLDELVKEIQDTRGGRWTEKDINFTTKEIEKIGKHAMAIESFLKDALGPSGFVVTAVLMAGLMGANPLGLALAGGAAALIGGALASNALWQRAIENEKKPEKDSSIGSEIKEEGKARQRQLQGNPGAGVPRADPNVDPNMGVPGWFPLVEPLGKVTKVAEGLQPQPEPPKTPPRDEKGKLTDPKREMIFPGKWSPPEELPKSPGWPDAVDWLTDTPVTLADATSIERNEREQEAKALATVSGSADREEKPDREPQSLRADASQTPIAQGPGGSENADAIRRQILESLRRIDEAIRDSDATGGIQELSRTMEKVEESNKDVSDAVRDKSFWGGTEGKNVSMGEGF